MPPLADRPAADRPAPRHDRAPAPVVAREFLRREVISYTTRRGVGRRECRFVSAAAIAALQAGVVSDEYLDGDMVVVVGGRYITLETLADALRADRN